MCFEYGVGSKFNVPLHLIYWEGPITRMASSRNDQMRCSHCEKTVRVNSPSISCSSCLSWFHKGCSGLTNPEFNKQASLWNKSKATTWTCQPCMDETLLQSGRRTNTKTKSRRSIGPGAALPEDVPENDQISLRDIMNKLLQIESQYSDLLSKYNEQIKINAELNTEIAEIKCQLSACNGPAATSSASMATDDLLRELHDREKRRGNFIIFGQPDSNSESISDQDKVTALNVLNSTLPNNSVDPVSIRTFRLGKFAQNKSRPIKVICGSQISQRVLSNSKILRNTPNLSSLSISSDKTPKQLQEYRETKQRLIDRLAAGESNLKIKYVNGSPRIVSVDVNHLNFQGTQIISPA